MKTNHVLVDFENTPDLDLKLVEAQPVEVYVLLGEKQKTLPVDLVADMLQHADKLKLIRTQCAGKNALDFVLAYIAGTLVAADPEGYYHVVSKDKGFDALVAHLRGNKIAAARHDAFRDVPLFRAATAITPEERASQYADHLARIPKNRPTRRKTLVSSISAHFAKTLSGEEVEAVIAGLIANGVLAIDEEGKVCYKRVSADSPKAVMAKVATPVLTVLPGA